MAKKYQLWIYIEEHDEEADVYEELDTCRDHLGDAYGTLQAAIDAANKLGVNFKVESDAAE